MTAHKTHDSGRTPRRSVPAPGRSDEFVAGATDVGADALPFEDTEPEFVWLEGDGLELFAADGPGSSAASGGEAALSGPLSGLGPPAPWNEPPVRQSPWPGELGRDF